MTAGPLGVEPKSYIISEGETRFFGRWQKNASNSVTCISDQTMSATHFSIKNLRGKIILEDCKSRNGTKVGNLRVSDQTLELHDGTVFKAGKTHFQVQWENSPQESDLVISPVNEESSVGQDSSGYRSPIESSILEISPVKKDLLPSLPPDTSEGSDTFQPKVTRLLDPVVRLIKHTSSMTSDFQQTIEAIAGHYDFFAISHFAKLGQVENDNPRGIPLFPHLDPTGDSLPTAIPKVEWMKDWHGSYSHRLIATDGLMLIVHRPSSADLRESLCRLGSSSLQGFSEEGGFVPWCWPSGASCVLESLSDAMTSNWLKPPFLALVFPREGRIVTYVRQSELEVFLQLGFF